MKSVQLLRITLLYLLFFSVCQQVLAQDSLQYGTPFGKVPDTRDIKYISGKYPCL